LFLTGGASWDLVVSGVNHGHNVGLDVFHSGTVGQAMIASVEFGVAAIAFGQEMEDTEPKDKEQDRILFKTARLLTPDFLKELAPIPGSCWNINFPAGPAQGYKTVPVAHYSRWRTPPTSIVPRARGEETDFTVLKKGFVSMSEISLRVSQNLRY